MYRGFRKWIVALVSCWALASAVPAYAENPIPAENQLPGTTQWQVTNPADDVNKQIKGYASATSVNKGGSIVFRVTVTPAQMFTIDIYRMGWYQGLGGRLMQHVEPIPGTTQPACPVDATTGSISCSWANAYTLDVPATWTTGIYLALLTNAQGYQSYITFVVRDDGHVGGLIYQQAVATYQAYNNYPRDYVTGKSLYPYNSYGANTVSGTPQAVKVSFDRPYSDEAWQHHGSGQFMSWEIYFVRWAERLGYELSYTTDIDTHTNPGRLRNAKGFLSVGHDEYWTKEMYDGAIAARDAGVGLAFFGANSLYMQIRLEPSPSSGVPERVIVLYRDKALDPVKGANATIAWRNLGRPEQQLLGVQYVTWLDTLQRPYAPYVITNSNSWVYAGTSFQDNDSVPGLIGYEIDQVMSGFPSPTAQPGTFAVLSRSPMIDFRNQTHESNSTIYQALSGAWVFAAGTIGWSWGLDKSDVVDPRLQKTTENILSRFLTDAPVVPEAPSSLVASAVGSTAINLSWADNSDDEAGFGIERSTSSTFNTVTTFIVAPNVASFADSGLLAATSYYYRVKAFNSGGSSSYTNNATATTAAAPVVTAPVNTSLPVISGSAEVGQMLTASTGSWSGSPTSYAFQWRRCDRNGYACATVLSANSYLLSSSDAGYTIRVNVLATNAAGTTGINSNPTAVVPGGAVATAPVNTSLPVISGSAEVGQMLTASTGSWSGSPTSYAFQWRRCDRNGYACATVLSANSYLLSSSDAGYTIRVNVLATNAAGTTGINSNPTAVVPGGAVATAPVNTSLPVISGSAEVGQMLTASTGSWSGSPTSYAFQWRRCDRNGYACATVLSANSYLLSSSDAGYTIRVNVLATNAAGTTGINSNPTAVVPGGAVATAPVNTSLPVISGSAEVGQMLTASTGSWSGSPTSYAFQWRRCDRNGYACATVLSANSYLLSSSDAGYTIRVNVLATNAAGTTGINSNPTAVVPGGAVATAPVNTSLPVISGSAEVGQMLTASTGSWSGSPTSYAFQWRRCDRNGYACATVLSANSYLLSSSDAGYTIRVNVLATNAAGTTGINSNPTAVVPAA